MKVRNGFVSNSSSSSFMIITPEMQKKAKEAHEKYQVKKVIRNQNCPYCKSENIEGYPIKEQDFTIIINETGRMYQHIMCLDCKKRWHDIFNFVETELLDDDYDD